MCLESLSYHEAWELSYFGASVLHPRTTMPAMKYSIPITIRNFFNRTARGVYATHDVRHPHHLLQLRQALELRHTYSTSVALSQQLGLEASSAGTSIKAGIPGGNAQYCGTMFLGRSSTKPLGLWVLASSSAYLTGVTVGHQVPPVSWL